MWNRYVSTLWKWSWSCWHLLPGGDSWRGLAEVGLLRFLLLSVSIFLRAVVSPDWTLLWPFRLTKRQVLLSEVYINVIHLGTSNYIIVKGGSVEIAHVSQMLYYWAEPMALSNFVSILLTVGISCGCFYFSPPWALHLGPHIPGKCSTPELCSLSLD